VRKNHDHQSHPEGPSFAVSPPPRHTQECHATLVLLIYDALHLIIDLLLQGLQRKQQKRQKNPTPKNRQTFQVPKMEES